MINITKEKFEKYVEALDSGITNVFNVKKVCALSGLTRDEVMDIMSNYGKYEHGNFAKEEVKKAKKKSFKCPACGQKEDEDGRCKCTNEDGK
jgi:hypothetical protein